MLRDIFENAQKDCRIEIAFNSTNQQNDFRDDLIGYIKNYRVDNGEKIAARLQSQTTKRSGLGLMFIIYGESGKKKKVVISRFPVEQGIYVEEGDSSLTVEFLDRIFMKSTLRYKAALFSGNSTVNGFWDGLVVDRQTNSKLSEASDYWIKEFLDSDFKTTSAAGTARLANALREAVSSANEVATKSALIGVTELVNSLDGQTTSIEKVCKRFAVPEEGMKLIRSQIKNHQILGERFKFSRAEFAKHRMYRAVETDRGVIIMAENSIFDDDVKMTPIEDSNEVEITTEGFVVDYKLRKGR